MCFLARLHSIWLYLAVHKSTSYNGQANSAQASGGSFRSAVLRSHYMGTTVQQSIKDEIMSTLILARKNNNVPERARRPVQSSKCYNPKAPHSGWWWKLSIRRSPCIWGDGYWLNIYFAFAVFVWNIMRHFRKHLWLNSQPLLLAFALEDRRGCKNQAIRSVYTLVWLNGNLRLT